jgi:hypothetical protein
MPFKFRALVEAIPDFLACSVLYRGKFDVNCAIGDHVIRLAGGVRDSVIKHDAVTRSLQTLIDAANSNGQQHVDASQKERDDSSAKLNCYNGENELQSNPGCDDYPVSLILSGVLWRARYLLSSSDTSCEDTLITLTLLAASFSTEELLTDHAKTMGHIAFRDCILRAAPDQTMYNALQAAFIEAGLGPAAKYLVQKSAFIVEADSDQGGAVPFSRRSPYSLCPHVFKKSSEDDDDEKESGGDDDEKESGGEEEGEEEEEEEDGEKDTKVPVVLDLEKDTVSEV